MSAPSPQAVVPAAPLGAGRWRVAVELPPGLPPTPADLTLRPLDEGAPAARVEALAAPLPSADALWTLVVAVDGASVAAGDYVLEAEGPPPWSTGVRLDAGAVSVPARTATADGSQPRPDIDYRARDFAALRTMLLQRMREQVGAALEEHPVAQTTALVELLAYLGDDLSYYLDGVATEAYLSTARRRISATRHAELLDFPVSDGCSARAWVRVEATAEASLPARAQLLTHVPGAGPAVTGDALDRAVAAGALVFETLGAVDARPGDRVFALDSATHPTLGLVAGATEATVVVVDGADVDGLAAQELVLVARCAGAPPTEGHVVRLTEATPTDDGAAMRLAWAAADGLPDDPLLLDGPVCVRAGNLVLAEHARTHPWTPLPPPAERLRYWPELPWPHVARSLGVEDGDVERSAAETLAPPDRAARPAVVVREGSKPHARYWHARPSLIDSGAFTPAFVVEVESDGSARLRFGDDVAGLRPAARASLEVRQRTGGGAAGNVGPGALRHVVDPPPGIAGAINVAAAELGADPDSLSAIRLRAPEAYRVNERAVTVDDHVELARAVDGVVDAAAVLTKTGSGPVAVVWVHAGGWPAATPALLQAVRAHLAARAPAGLALDVRAGVPMPARAELEVTAAPGWALALVGRGVDRALAPWLPGRERFTFGTALHRSELVAAVAAVEGVADVTVTALQWAHEAGPDRHRDALVPAAGRIIRIDNDAAAPARGLIAYRIRGLAG